MVRGFAAGCISHRWTKRWLTTAPLCPVATPQSIKEEKGSDAAVAALARALDGPTLLVKGKADRISNGDEVEEMLFVEEAGGLKRCGGQGDVLSGCLATFLAWTTASRTLGHGTNVAEDRLPLLAAYGASTITRRCSHKAFKRTGRAMLAHDMIAEIGDAYTQ